jgi:UDP-N-acetylglucosamine--N-acetylmuramyl-(pentapeptide) pyrophosphoryl-undecaprenol N-acetylglucosamine transferase
VKNKKYIISGGGTGGHIFPALSIAKEIKNSEPKSEILFVGSIGKMEMKKIPDSGFNITGIPIDGIQRSFSCKNILFPFKLLTSIIKSFFIIIKFKPDIIIGTGGYASGPVVFVSQIMGYSTLIQEQNSYPGITNKILALKANIISVAYSRMDKHFSKEKIVLTGNPVRKDIIVNDAKLEDSKLFFNLDPKKPVIGIVGGSQGALNINRIIASNIHLFDDLGVQVIWQCGKIYFEKYKLLQTKNIKVIPFINKMNFFYKSVDLLITRSGASTISEITVTSTPSILVPSPNVSENHQYHNAIELYNLNAAEMIEEKDLEKKFKTVLTGLWLNNSIRIKMKKNLKKLSKPNATKDIVELIKKQLIEEK